VTQEISRRKPRKNVRKKSPRSLPPWLWLATGLSAGLLLGFLYHLGNLPRERASGDDSKMYEAAQTEQQDEVEFNFYTLLPQREVMVSTDRQPSRAKTASNIPTDATRKQDAVNKQKATPGYHYYLQAGSFQHREQAEKRRIQLILLNMEANIEKVKHQGKSWYRVQSGPYVSISQLSGAQSKLSGESIDTLVTKRKTN
jgi:cell division protein FtsN